MAPPTERLFVALDLPSAARAALAAFRDAGADPDVWRPLADEALHVTLVFLGHRPPGEADAVAAVLRGCAGPAADLALGPALLLPPRRARVLCAEVVDRSGSLAALQARVAAGLAEAGLHQSERRPFRAHATVARLRAGALATRGPGASEIGAGRIRGRGADALPLASGARAAPATSRSSGSRSAESGQSSSGLARAPAAGKLASGMAGVCTRIALGALAALAFALALPSASWAVTWRSCRVAIGAECATLRVPLTARERWRAPCRSSSLACPPTRRGPHSSTSPAAPAAPGSRRCSRSCRSRLPWWTPTAWSGSTSAAPAAPGCCAAASSSATRGCAACAPERRARAGSARRDGSTRRRTPSRTSRRSAPISGSSA